MDIYARIKEKREELGLSQYDLALRTGYKSRSSINKIEKGLRDINQNQVAEFAKALNTTPAYLMGWEDTTSDNNTFLKPPHISDNVVTFPVIGTIAAGYDEIAVEDWSGDTIEVPQSLLKGRNHSNFLVLSVHGDSMYPMYIDGDKVLILKQPTLDSSGDIGAIIYENDCATLKKIEYVDGEDWLKLVPLNPEFMPKTIAGIELEQCKVIGIPFLLIRDLSF